MFAKFFIDRPIFAWVIALIILLGGGLALRQLPVASYPAVAPPALSITVNYPGASAQVVEETAVALIEQEMNGIDRLLYMDSSSELGVGTVNLTFEAGTNLDLASVEPMTQPYPLVNVMRDDVVAPSLDRDEVLAAAPAAEDGRFRVPPIIGLEG